MAKTTYVSFVESVGVTKTFVEDGRVGITVSSVDVYPLYRKDTPFSVLFSEDDEPIFHVPGKVML